jgi:hypothetical protein
MDKVQNNFLKLVAQHCQRTFKFVYVKFQYRAHKILLFYSVLNQLDSVPKLNPYF